MDQLSQEISNHVTTANAEIVKANIENSLEEIRIKYLGKNGVFTAYLKQLNQLPADQKPQFGKVINEAKTKIEAAITQKKDEFAKEAVAKKLTAENIDITLPGIGLGLGSLHPVTKVATRMAELFKSMGFLVLDDLALNREIEDEFHNFDALNMPTSHPARSDADTFYLENGKYLLRTQTSPSQIRAIEKYGVPIRVVAPGKVYRRDFDPTHVPMFHQIEGLLIDKNISFADLKGVIYEFLSKFFEQDVKLRFRSSYFPFTEPSAEADLLCVMCEGKGCKLCKNSGWLEVGGCGMVHPNVLKAVNIDSEQYRGFAFGMGIDRFAMRRYGIGDLRLLFENDLRFIEQF
jgi:phenylalanyl-tRNA synthetase alpha chain